MGFKLHSRIIAGFLVAVISFSVICAPVAASDFDLTPDTASVGLWSTSIKSPANTILQALAGAFNLPVDYNGVFWYLMNSAVGKTGPQSLDYMNDLLQRYKQAFNSEYYDSIWQTVLKNSQALGRQSFASCFFAQGFLDFELVQHPSSGLLRIREKNSGRWVVNSAGEYPYCEGGSMASTSGGNKWLGDRSASTAKVNMKTLDALNLMCIQIKKSGIPAEIRMLGTNYKAIWWNRQYYADSEGRPFVAYVNEGQAAINQPRPDTSVTDETGEVIDNSDNSTNIDLSGMTITLPDGTLQVADNIIYDESNKTYYIDSHDTYNTYITYNYSWTYHINYTSITYIGQTEQYDKYYEVYYELPDGRDSADLTAEELEQLDFNIDVVGYGRSADDTSLRALYHFDGDTRDSSYWNYMTSFYWINGASLTYMDAGSFNGSLFLDESPHGFVLVLPSNIGNGDFTMQFRYYQSATAAPQSDSSIFVWTSDNYSAGNSLVTLDGKQLKKNSNASTYSTGQWNEICFQRSNGVIYYFLNGLVVFSSADTSFYYDRIYFSFGSAQQTYKYLDEFRFVNKALYGTSGYTPSSVPFDTNLTLVLPDSAKPVADEYWSWDTTVKPTYAYDFTNQNTSGRSLFANGDIQQLSDCIRMSGQSVGLKQPLYFNNISNGVLLDVSYTFSIVTKDGTVYSAPNVFPDLQNGQSVFTFPFGSIRSVSYNQNPNSDYPLGFTSVGWYIDINTGQSLDIVYAEIVPGIVPNVGHKYVTAIIPVTNYEKPTLAVRTDIPITGKQIGGARPSLPTKGLVWAMVESGVIRSLQIYNGTAWEACDGRIFTGTRWIPYSGYNIITLKDFYDVVDASGDNYEYIYSESGFWNWWQKSWNAFTNKLFAALSSAGFDVDSGTGQSGSLWSRIKNAFNNSLGVLIESLFGLITDVLSALLSLATDMLSFFFGFLTDATVTSIRAFFSAFSDSTLFDFFQQPPTVGPDGTETGGGYGLPSEVGTAFGFISGVIMVLPPDLRSILFFGLAVMVLLGVFKLVKT
ncbi:hypothetical protein [uncultured Oscillibacter sp.]|uniref:hypothetical protein n=1 Tax=uncultured Oscillibacter sp. TaxID=876091 RepID=UPI0025D23217|nr:hypothetical protein [uncultured Oscillibacter sp.]